MDTQRRIVRLFLKAFIQIIYLCDLYPPHITFVAVCFKTKQCTEVIMKLCCVF